MSPRAAILYLAGRLGAPVEANSDSQVKSGSQVKHLPPGRLVDSGGYCLHLHCEGEGWPTVVLDAGLGAFSLSWARVLPAVAQFTRVCAYDRAGLGWSERSPRPRTAHVMVEELRSLLTRAEVPGPYVLAGASLGGLNAKLYAHRYAEETAGLVLVDAAHEEQYVYAQAKESAARLNALAQPLYRAMELLIATGLPAAYPRLLPIPADELPPEVAEAYRALLTADTKIVHATAAELAALEASHAQVRAEQIRSLGDLPLVVLRRGKPRPAMASLGVTQLVEGYDKVLQARNASLSPAGRLIVADRSERAIEHEQPTLVVEAIRQVVEAVRDRTPFIRALTGGREELAA